MDGILVVNKEIGYTSRDVVNIVSKSLGTKKVGHTGTLDPMASGVLIVCVGKALKVCELLTNHDKEYIASVYLGIETDTLDMEGKILEKKEVNIEESKIKSVVNSFKKTYMQEVPKYSAVKVNGKKLYEYARNNQEVELPKRLVNIYEIGIVDNKILYEDLGVNFKIKCHVSKGTYIRSLVRDIGKELDCPAVMNGLIRTRQGNFNLEDAYNLENIKMGNFKLVNITDAFDNIPVVKVNDEVAFKIKNGVIMDKFFDSEMAFILDNKDNLLALYRVDGNKCRAYKVF